MDYLNPQKRRKHLIFLFSGYFLAALLIAGAVAVLFFLVRGFGYHDGVVVRSGMTFISSTPSGALVTANGQPEGTTNERLTLLAGKYDIQLTKDGYRPWQRTIELAGGAVQRYDYPLLIPNQLTSTNVLPLKYRPDVASESPNRELLLFSNRATPFKFQLVNISDPSQPKTTSLTLPKNILTNPGHGSWQIVEWSDDNQHVLLKYGTSKTYEYVVLDTDSPAKSVNLGVAFGFKPVQVQLFNDKYDQYWFYNPSSGKLLRADLGDATATPFLSNVLAFKPYSDNVVLYVTASKTVKNKARLLWHQDDKDHEIADRLTLSKPDKYLLDLARYKDDWYVVIGDSNGDGVAVYKNPLDSLSDQAKDTLPPYWRVSINKPNYVKFSASAQFILVENGTRVSVFDNYTHKIHNYRTGQLDKPQKHLTWMDGDHLLRIGGGQLNVSDFNNINNQTLVAADPAYEPFFDTSYRYLFTLSKSDDGVMLNSTPLRLPADM